jgi:hypothetical protein
MAYRFKPMNAIETISDLFSMFHDGGIKSWEGDESKLTLTIGCTYLAEKIDTDFDFFYLELTNIEKLQLECWVPEGKSNILICYDDIFKNDLEISSSEVIDGEAIVYFHQQFYDGGFKGGMMSVMASGVKLFQQDMKELTHDGISGIFNSYWDSFGKK